MHWNALDSADALLPPPYSVTVPDGHVSLDRSYNKEETTNERQESSETEDLNTTFHSLQIGDTEVRHEVSAEPSIPARQDCWRRRLRARSAPDLSLLVSHSSTLPRRTSVSPFREEGGGQTLENLWPNRQLSRRSLDETTSRRRSDGMMLTSLSVSRIRSPETVRAERRRRKRMRRRSTPQRLDFGRCPVAGHSSSGLSLQPSIMERNRSVPDFSPFVMAISPNFQFGTKVRQRSTSAPLPEPVTALGVAPAGTRHVKHTSAPHATEMSSTPETVCSEVANPQTFSAMKRLSRTQSLDKQPSVESETPFRLPAFGRTKLPPIMNVSTAKMSTTVADKSIALKVGRQPDEMLSADSLRHS